MNNPKSNLEVGSYPIKPLEDNILKKYRDSGTSIEISSDENPSGSKPTKKSININYQELFMWIGGITIVLAVIIFLVDLRFNLSGNLIDINGKIDTAKEHNELLVKNLENKVDNLKENVNSELKHISTQISSIDNKINNLNTNNIPKN